MGGLAIDAADECSDTAPDLVGRIAVRTVTAISDSLGSTAQQQAGHTCRVRNWCCRESIASGTGNDSNCYVAPGTFVKMALFNPGSLVSRLSLLSGADWEFVALCTGCKG